MYAVIETGGKQYKVALDNEITIEKLDAEVGSTVEFPVLMLGTQATSDPTSAVKVGAPYLSDVSVKAEVLSQTRGKKLKIIKFRRRKHHQKATGHRQYHTLVKITHILGASINGN